MDVIIISLFAITYTLFFLFAIYELYVKNRVNAWKNTDPLLGVVLPNTKSQKKEDEKE